MDVASALDTSRSLADGDVQLWQAQLEAKCPRVGIQVSPEKPAREHAAATTASLECAATTPGEPRALAWNRRDPEDVARWSFYEPTGMTGFAAAVAVEGTEGDACRGRWRGENVSWVARSGTGSLDA